VTSILLLLHPPNSGINIHSISLHFQPINSLPLKTSLPDSELRNKIHIQTSIYLTVAVMVHTADTMMVKIMESSLFYTFLVILVPLTLNIHSYLS
jgi:hypothetical protein